MTLPSSFTDRDVCVIGLGYVGLTLSVAMADTGFKVQGVEVRDEVLDLLEQGKSHFWEPRLEEKLQRGIARGNFTFARDPSPDGANVFIITVGTPLDQEGRIRIDMIEQATRQVGGCLKDGDLVILRSTVKLGTAREVVKPLLDATKKKYQLAFCPERTLEGRALIELHELPQVIGADDPETRWRCSQLFSLITPTTVALNSLETAELVKLVDNTYRDLSFGFANEIAKLCSHAGISANEVIRAGKLGYPRTNVALPGPVGGPCLEKDPHILVESAKKWNVDLPITLAGRLTNERQPQEIAAIIRAKLADIEGFPERPVVSLLGLAFKGRPPTDDLRGTMARPIAEALRKVLPDAQFRGYDPVAGTEAIEAFFNFPAVASLDAAFDGADLVLLLNNHPDLQQMDLANLARSMRGPGIVYDLWNMHEDASESMPSGIASLSLGNEKVKVAT